jgi:hypothetical protein
VPTLLQNRFPAAGAYGLGSRNERGTRLLQFCGENSMCVTNTFFKLPPRRLYTWKSPADTEEHLVRNQIDFILINKQFKRFVKSAKTYPGADLDSDHNPVVMEMKMKRFRKIKKTESSKIADALRLKSKTIKKIVSESLEMKFKDMSQNPRPNEDAEELWKSVKTAITEIQSENLKPPGNKARKEWMTEDILKMMNERQMAKQNPAKYKQINRNIRKACSEAKEKWWTEKCAEIEELQAKHDSFNLHKKVKEVAGRYQKHHTNTLKDAKIIIGIEGKLKMWQEYVRMLFHDDRIKPAIEVDNLSTEDGPPITRSEVLNAIKCQKNNKAPWRKEMKRA